MYPNKMNVLKHHFGALIFFVGLTTNVFSDVHIYFFDVGQGNCILLRNETNAILVDAGGSDSKTFEDLEVPLKTCLGSAKIDGIILTHQHDDHTKFVDDILRNREIFAGENVFIFSIRVPDISSADSPPLLIWSENPKNLSAAISETEPYSAEKLNEKQKILNALFPGGNFEFLIANWFNFQSYKGERKNLNDTSLVFSFAYNGVKTLFTGDSTGPAFDNYTGQNENSNWSTNRAIIKDTNIFVMPHHGADSDGSWRWTLNVTKDNPNLLAAIISVNPEKSPYEHPRAWIKDVTWPKSMRGEAHNIGYNQSSANLQLPISDNLFTTSSFVTDHFIEIVIDEAQIRIKEDGFERFTPLRGLKKIKREALKRPRISIVNKIK